MLLTFDEFVLPFGLVGLVLLMLFLRFHRRSWLECIASPLFYLYLLAAIGLPLFSVPILDAPENRQSTAHILARVNLIPFTFGHLFEPHPNVIWRELGGNIC